MENIKCIIGATIGVPLVIGALMAGVAGFIFLLELNVWVPLVLGGVIVTFFAILLWLSLFSYCVEHHSAKKSNK